MKWQIKAPHYLTLLSCCILHEAIEQNLKKVVGVGYHYRFSLFKNEEATGYSLFTETEKIVSHLRKRILAKENFAQKNFADYYLIEKKNKKFLADFQKVDLSQKSNKELLELFNQFLEQYKDFLVYGPVTGRVVSKAISVPVKEVLSQKISKAGKTEDDYLNQLILPTKDTFQIKQEKELLQVAIKFAHLKNKLIKIQQTNKKKSWSKSKVLLDKIDPQLSKSIGKITQRYCWLPVFQENDPWDEVYFFNTLINLLKTGNLKQEFEKFKKKKSKLKKEQKKLFDKLSLPVKIKRLIKFLEGYSYLRTRFGNMMGYINYYIQPLFREIAHRTGLSLLDFKYLTLPEVEKALLTGSMPPLKELRTRREFCILIRKNRKHSVLIGQRAKKFLANEVKDEVDKNIVEFQGKTAYPGKVRGKVKIVLTPRTMSKMKKGDILVTPMTTTDLIMAIKKAAAIVTDIGGLTCHAAIISREFGIPCIIESKIGTQVLKDGDLVEVDANKGVVRKI